MIGPTVWLRARPVHRALARTLTREVTAALLALGQPRAEVSLTLLGDVAMRRLNRTARGIDRTTDVLSFPQAKVPGSRMLGDLVVSVAVARREAQRRGRALSRELRLAAIHGLLHLLGHDHHTPRELARMAAAEQRLLGETGLITRASPERASPELRTGRARARRRPAG